MGAEHGHTETLAQVVILLAALALAGPAARLARTSAVLAYLVLGIAIGPYGLGRVHPGLEAKNIIGIAEFGVVLLLFVIGLELRPKRLWAMRSTVFGTGTLQVSVTGLLLMAAGMALGLALGPALFVGLALSLSSTALSLQVLEEKGEVVSQHGRTAFAILLMQDIASIPLIALAPLFAAAAVVTGSTTPLPGWEFALTALGTIAVVAVAGRLLLGRLYRLAARSGVKEATSAAALLTVASMALLMSFAGLSAALGAFIAGALLADSEFRHDIEANIAPFEGLLLGLFFTVIGMSLELRLLLDHPFAVAGGVAGLLIVKGAVLWGLGRQQGLSRRGSRRLALAASQGGEFAFVLLAAGVTASVIAKSLSDMLGVIVTLTMIATPLLMSLDDRLFPKSAGSQRAFDKPREEKGHVIIAGFGRFGQIVARVLTARGIPFIALDDNVEQVDFVRRFGSEVYYGDARRLDLLAAAKAHQARAFVLAIDNVEASLSTAEVVRRHYPDLPIFARARNRQHVYKLMDLGIEAIRRETFLSAIDLTRLLLVGLGTTESEASRLTETFKEHDRKRLYADYAHYDDLEKLTLKTRESQKELEELFATDLAASANETAVRPKS
jgi:monovalent cation:proton antiporter-2 (CPA2) family protein